LFSALISNVDDHLRNHGFLYDSAQRGWRLSPAYDINPVPPDVKARYLSMLVDERDNEASFDLVMSTGEYYGLAGTDMKRIVQEVVASIAGWRAAVARIGISRRETDRMAGAFEHDALAAARAFVK
jgi:serine/threonine-protein kinase HipA